MNRREASKIETRDLIIKTTRRLLMEKEVAQCTMRNIAAEAGVSAASVVVHFKNKHALLEAALAKDIDHTIARAIASMPTDGDLGERLTHIWHAMYQFYATNRDLYRSLIRGTIFEPEEQTPYISKQLEQFIGFLTQMVTAEKAEGRLKSVVEPRILAESMVCLYIGVLIMFYRNPDMTPQEALARVSAMTKQVLACLTVPLSEV